MAKAKAQAKKKKTSAKLTSRKSTPAKVGKSAKSPKASATGKSRKAKPAAKSTKTSTSKSKSKTLTPAKGAKVIPFPVKKTSKAGDWSQILTPLDDRVLIQVEEGERVTPGGLFIPDTVSMEGNFRGIVVSVGPGHRDKKGRLRPLELKVGDRVLFSEYAGTEVLLENQNFKILRETDILGIVTL